MIMWKCGVTRGVASGADRPNLAPEVGKLFNAFLFDFLSTLITVQCRPIYIYILYGSEINLFVFIRKVTSLRP